MTSIVLRMKLVVPAIPTAICLIIFSGCASRQISLITMYGEDPVEKKTVELGIKMLMRILILLSGSRWVVQVEHFQVSVPAYYQTVWPFCLIPPQFFLSYLLGVKSEYLKHDLRLLRT